MANASKQGFQQKDRQTVIAKPVIARERFAEPSLLTSPESDRGNLHLCREPSTPIGRLPRSLPGLLNITGSMNRSLAMTGSFLPTRMAETSGPHSGSFNLTFFLTAILMHHPLAARFFSRLITGLKRAELPGGRRGDGAAAGCSDFQWPVSGNRRRFEPVQKQK